MVTPEQRYRTDAMFRNVVDSLEALIHHAQLTPSEIREAATLAAINYEMHTVRRRVMPVSPDQLGAPFMPANPPRGE